MEHDNLSCSGRPLELNLELLKLVMKNARLTLQHFVEQLGRSHTVVEKPLNELDKTWRCGVWIRHDLSPHQLQYRVDVCMNLVTSHRNLITSDEK